jgi:carbamoyltransferase
MYTLGITSGSDSGVALFEDGQLKLAVNEERLSREKLDDRYPELALSWCLREAGIGEQDVERICYGFSNGMEQGTFVSEFAQALLDDASEAPARAVIEQRVKTENDVDTQKRREFDELTRARFPGVPIYRCHHHQSHQAAAFVPSPFDEALVVTADGRGDFKSLTVSAARGGEFIELFFSPSWASLGYFYGRVTHLCGFKANRHEGKVTGLAARGDPRKAAALMQRMIRWDGERLRPRLGDDYTPFFTNYSAALLEEAARYSREDLAAAAQAHLEQCMCAIVAQYVERTGLGNVCLAGGVFANVKLNQRIRALPGVREVFVYPHMSDGGVMAGAAYRYLHLEHKRRPALGSLYLGPRIDAEAIAATLAREGYTVHPAAAVQRRVLELLEADRAVALVQGRTEFGPRALGHRSILASPFNPELSRRLNAMMHRDEFMPFAPAIAADFAPRCLKNYSPDCVSARHMTLSFDVTPEFHHNSPGAVHVDGTARPQVVHEQDNPVMYAILKAWHARSGGLCLLNTSFNMHEEPIVTTDADVMHAFRRNVIDAVWAPPYLIERSSA